MRIAYQQFVVLPTIPRPSLEVLLADGARLVEHLGLSGRTAVTIIEGAILEFFAGAPTATRASTRATTRHRAPPVE